MQKFDLTNQPQHNKLKVPCTFYEFKGIIWRETTHGHGNSLRRVQSVTVTMSLLQHRPMNLVQHRPPAANAYWGGPGSFGFLCLQQLVLAANWQIWSSLYYWLPQRTQITGRLTLDSKIRTPLFLMEQSLIETGTPHLPQRYRKQFWILLVKPIEMAWLSLTLINICYFRAFGLTLIV